MSSWINRTVLSGSSVAENGTTSHTCTFTAATSGSLLIAVLAGSVTSTTPSGWSLVISAINFTGLYVFSKTASAGESSFSTTHNTANFAIEGVVYEFYTGSSVVGTAGSATSMSSNATGPACTSLTGTYTSFAARSWDMSATNSSASAAWTLPSIEDYDASVPKVTNDGIYLTTAYDDNSTGTSFTPSSTLTLINTTGNGEGVSFALSVTTPPAASNATIAWLKA